MSAWNNSTFADDDSCARLYWQKHVARRKLIHEASLPGYTDRFEGTLGHKILATHYADNLSSGRVVIGPTFAGLIAAAEFDEERGALEERRDWWFKLYDAYREHYASDFDSWEILGVEERFITVLGDDCPGCGRRYAEALRRGTALVSKCDCGEEIDYVVGQLDLRVREHGVMKVIDHKFPRKSVGEWKLASFNEDSQFTQYLYGASRVHGEEIGAATANCIARLKLVDERGNPFHRNNEIVRGQADFDAFVAERRAQIAAIRYRHLANIAGPVGSPGAWPRTPSSCRRFGLCDFYGACWPTRPDWWALPDDLAESFEQKPLTYVEDYDILIEEDVR